MRSAPALPPDRSSWMRWLSWSRSLWTEGGGGAWPDDSPKRALSEREARSTRSFSRPSAPLSKARPVALAAFGHADYLLPELLVGLTSTRGFRYRTPAVLS